MKRREWIVVILSLLLIFAFGESNFVCSQDTGESEEPVVPDIETWTQLPPDHQEIDLAGPCMACHNYKIDATTTATEQMIRIGTKLEKEVL